MYIDVIGEIEEIQTIAVGGRIQDIMRIRKQYGPGRWRKLKGVANVRLQNGRNWSPHGTKAEAFP